MRFINSFFVIIIFLMVIQNFSNSVLYSQEIPYIQYKKPDGTIAKYPLSELKSITFGYLTCYDKCLVVFNDGSNKDYDPRFLDKISFDSVNQKILFNAFGIDDIGRKHGYQDGYSIKKISYINFYEFLDNIINGKRLIEISVKLLGLHRKLIEEKIDIIQMNIDKHIDTLYNQDDINLDLVNPTGCYGASIKDSKIFLSYYNYFNKGMSGSGETNYLVDINLDTLKRVITSLSLVKIDKDGQTSGSHVLTNSASHQIEIKNIPYQLNQNGFIEVLNTEIPISNINSYTYKKVSSYEYSGGSGTDTITLNNFDSDNDKVIISLGFGWVDK